MAKFATHMGDPHGEPQTTPQHADPHGLLVCFSLKGPKSMWIGVLWGGVRAAMWITHVGGRFRHGLPEKSLIRRTFRTIGPYEFPQEIHMDQRLVHTNFPRNLYGPMALKVL